MKSCLYTGTIRHRRLVPRAHEFQYRIFMTFVDLSELPSLFDRFWLWSARRPALAWFRRKDFYGDSAVPLDTAIRDLVATRTGRRPAGPIRMLTHLRYFGHSFNPVTFYYVYDVDEQVETIVAEITNTPWKERHAYVLDVSAQDAPRAGAPGMSRWHFDKTFHVSPFLPMAMQYDWRFSEPAAALSVHMECWQDVKHFDATLILKRQPVSHTALARALLSFPLITVQVAFAIYWQALRLWLKRVPLFTHPEKLAT